MANRNDFWAHTKKDAVNLFFSTCRLKEGVYQIGLYIADDDGARFAWMNSFFEKVAGGPVEYIAKPVVLPQATTGDDLKYGVDYSGVEKGLSFIGGWVVLAGAEMNDYDAYLAITDDKGVAKTFYAPLYTRMDIAAMYNDARAANCGFGIKMRASEITPGMHAVEVRLKSQKTGETVKSAQTVTRHF
jgi:hypothetical protein